MATKFDSKEEAILTGFYYVGRKDLCLAHEKKSWPSLDDILKNPEIKIVNDNISQFGYVHKDCTMIEFKNGNGTTVRIATTKFRDGFDLWIIDPKREYAGRI